MGQIRNALKDDLVVKRTQNGGNDDYVSDETTLRLKTEIMRCI